MTSIYETMDKMSIKSSEPAQLQNCVVPQTAVLWTAAEGNAVGSLSSPFNASLYNALSSVIFDVLWTNRSDIMGLRDILTDEERRMMFGVPEDHDALVKLYTLSRRDLDLIEARRLDANRLGFAVQLALLRHPGFPLEAFEAPDHLIAFLAAQLDIRRNEFAGYGERGQTVTDHARELMTLLGLRPSVEGDLALMIDAAKTAAWGTDRGAPIVRGVVCALSAAGIVLPTLARIERAAIAGRSRGRKAAYAALLAQVTGDQIAKLGALLVVDEKNRAHPTRLDTRYDDSAQGGQCLK